MPRIAIALGQPPDISIIELIQRSKTQLQSSIPPVFVEPADAPINTNHLLGPDVDVTRFPAPKHWPRDGGRYIGTADAMITRDSDGGWLNVGTYRMMVHDKNHVGLHLSLGKDARLHIERYWSRGEPCEIVAVWGVIPALFEPTTLACMHGSAWRGDGAGSLRGLAGILDREQTAKANGHAAHA